MLIYIMSNKPFAPFIIPKNDLQILIKKDQIINNIIKRLEELPDHKNLKDDLETLLFVCVLVEHYFSTKNKKEKVNKKDIVIEIFEKCFGSININKDNISKNIQFLFNNNRIKKITTYQYCCGIVYDWFNRKIM